jgi:hypothetical protein
VIQETQAGREEAKQRRQARDVVLYGDGATRDAGPSTTAAAAPAGTGAGASDGGSSVAVVRGVSSDLAAPASATHGDGTVADAPNNAPPTTVAVSAAAAAAAAAAAEVASRKAAADLLFSDLLAGKFEEPAKPKAPPAPGVCDVRACVCVVGRKQFPVVCGAPCS